RVDLQQGFGQLNSHRRRIGKPIGDFRQATAYPGECRLTGFGLETLRAGKQIPAIVWVSLTNRGTLVVRDPRINIHIAIEGQARQPSTAQCDASSFPRKPVTTQHGAGWRDVADSDRL